MNKEKNWPGSRWWKFDFHTHTPASADYGKGANQASLRKITPEEWLLEFMHAGIDCVAVTDHNSGGWIDKLKEKLEEMNQQRPKGYCPLCLFPGVEISANGGIHILAVFNPDKGTSDINLLLGAVGYQGTKGKCDDCTTKSLIEVIDKIIQAGGLAVPAHVDKSNGLFKQSNGGPTLGQILDCKDIIAMELCDPGYSKPRLYQERKVSWSEVLGSDSHHTNSNGSNYPGSHYTWVKMETPGLEGLRLSLLDGALSVKRFDACPKDPNLYEHNIIESLTIENAKYIGREGRFECRFNPWLNAVIGGRGTGKSTLLECLRLTLRREQELPEGLKQDFGKYQQVNESRQDEGLLTPEAKLTTAYRKDKTVFRVQWAYSGTLEPIMEETPEGNWQSVQGDITQRFPVRIYSQKQIFELAKQPQALLKIIDDAPEVGYNEWQEKWNELWHGYLSLRVRMREIEAGFNDEPRIKGELDDVKRRLKVFETAGHADILKTYQQRQRLDRGLETWEESWSQTGDQIRRMAEQIRPADVDESLFDQTQDKGCLKDVQKTAKQIDGICEKLKHLAGEADQIGVAWQKTKESSEWKEVIKQTTADYKQLCSRLEEADAGDPTEYGLLVQRRQSLEERLQQLESQKQVFQKLDQSAGDNRKEMKRHRWELFKRREGFLARVLARNKYVSIKVTAYGHRAAMEAEFREIINRPQGGFENDIDGLMEDLCKATVSNAADFENHLDNFKKTIAGIKNPNRNQSYEARDRRFIQHIQNLQPDNFDRLDCWFPEDSLEISYSVREGGGFKPLQQGSPGQKTAALLAFLLSYGKEPLILDQPEDDLDNHLIYDLVVTQIREIKQRRQVIIVTHNANIVVNGDAEMVVALDVSNGQTQKICEGSLQKSEVREEICQVMEGGKEAFELRYRRINAGGRHV